MRQQQMTWKVTAEPVVSVFAAYAVGTLGLTLLDDTVLSLAVGDTGQSAPVIRYFAIWIAMVAARRQAGAALNGARAWYAALICALVMVVLEWVWAAGRLVIRSWNGDGVTLSGLMSCAPSLQMTALLLVLYLAEIRLGFWLRRES